MRIEFLSHDVPEGHARLKLAFSASEVLAELELLVTERKNNDSATLPTHNNDTDDPLLENVADILINKAIDVAVKNHGFRPAGRISVHMDTCSEVNGIIAVLEAEILPDIAVPSSFEGLKIRIEEAIPLKSEIYAMLERLRRSKGKLEPVNESRLPQAGDVLSLCVDGYRNGELLPELHVENYLLNDANASRAPEIAAVARTLHVGESATCTLADSSLFSSGNVCAQGLEIKVTLCTLKKEILPECDDAFAQKCGFDSLDKLISALYRERMAFLIGRNRKRAESAILEELLKGQTYAVPPSILKAHERECLLEAEADLRKKALSSHDVASALERRRPALLAEAARQAKAQTWLMACAYAHGLRVTKHELSMRIGQIAIALGKEEKDLQEEFETSGAVFELQDRLLAEKALSMIYVKAHKMVVDAKGNEVTVTKGQ